METVHALEQAHLAQPSHLTIGSFDGVHRGHCHLIGTMAQEAHAAGRVAVAVTFDPHPGALLGRRPRRIFHAAAGDIPRDVQQRLEAIWRALAGGTLQTGASGQPDDVPPVPLGEGMPPVGDDAPTLASCE